MQIASKCFVVCVAVAVVYSPLLCAQSTNSQSAPVLLAAPSLATNNVGLLTNPEHSFPYLLSAVSLMLTGLTFLTGLSIWQGFKGMKEAREQFDKISEETKTSHEKFRQFSAESQAVLVQFKTDADDYKRRLDDNFAKKWNDFDNASDQRLESFFRATYEHITITRYKKALLEELCEESPDKETIYCHLTEILNFPDQKSFEIFALCIQKLATDQEILDKVAQGLENFRRQYYLDPRNTSKASTDLEWKRGL